MPDQERDAAAMHAALEAALAVNRTKVEAWRAERSPRGEPLYMIHPLMGSGMEDGYRNGFADAWHAALAHAQSDDRWIAGYEAGHEAALASFEKEREAAEELRMSLTFWPAFTCDSPGCGPCQRRANAVAAYDAARAGAGETGAKR